jgi:hypothetical protein
MIAIAQVARFNQEQAQSQASIPPALRAEVQAARERAQARTQVRWRRNIYLSVAAAVALLAAFGTYFWIRPPLNKRLYQEFFVAAQPYGVTQGSRVSEGLVAYRDGDYRTAITALGNLSPTDSSYALARFFLAQSHMALGETPAATTVLEDLLEGEMNEELLHETEWYLALGYLDMGLTEEAKGQLRKLSALAGNARQAGAEALMKRLE